MVMPFLLLCPLLLTSSPPSFLFYSFPFPLPLSYLPSLRSKSNDVCLHCINEVSDWIVSISELQKEVGEKKLNAYTVEHPMNTLQKRMNLRIIYLYIHSTRNNFQKRMTSLQRIKVWVSSVSIIWGFHCMYQMQWIVVPCLVFFF